MEKCDKPDCKPSKYLLYFVVLLPCSLEVFFPLRGFLCVIEGYFFVWVGLGGLGSCLVEA